MKTRDSPKVVDLWWHQYMTEFWEENFKDKQKMWGTGAAPAAEIACLYFKDKG